MRKTYLLLLIFLLTFSRFTFAQKPGYVITYNNDTIRAEVKMNFFGNLKIKPYNGKEKLGEDDVKEYQLSKNASIYRLVAIKKGSIETFLHLLENGRICLYEMRITATTSTGGGAFGTPTNTYSTTTTDWYVNKDGGDVITLKTSSPISFGASHDTRKKELGDLLSDQPDVAAEYKADDSFSFKNIRKYIHEYNLAAGKK